MKKLTASLLAFITAIMLVAAMSTAVVASEPAKTLSYAKDGLVLWLDGFDASTMNVNADGSATWTDKVSGKTYTLAGNKENGASGWEARENGGIGYTAPLSAFQNGSLGAYGIDLGALPSGDYTVEIVLAVHPLALDPVEEGKASTQSAYYYANALSFGDFAAQMAYKANGDKTMSSLASSRFFVKASTAGVTDPAEKAELEKLVAALYGTETLNGGVPKSFSVSRDVTEGVDFDGIHTTDGKTLRNSGKAGKVTTAEYSVYTSEALCYTFSTDSVYATGNGYNDTIAMPNEHPNLVIGKDAPMTVYSVRVYDRNLTEAERNSNHIEDLSGYYGVDSSDYRAVSTAFSVEDTRTFMASLSALGFSGGKTETQDLINNFCIANCMEFLGVAAEYSGLNGVRGEFRVKDSMIEKFESIGYKVEYGVLAGKSATHSFKDVKVGAAGVQRYSVYKTEDGYKAENFISRQGGYSRFALATIWGPDATRDDAHTRIAYRGYLILTKDGVASAYYLDGKTSKIGATPSTYGAYQYLMNHVYKGNETIANLVETFKIYYYISVDPYASDASDYGTGSGEKDSPYLVETLADAYTQAVETINTTCTDIVVNLSSGQHKVGAGILMDGSDIFVADYSIRFVGAESDQRIDKIFTKSNMEGLPSLISSCVDIDGAEFVPVDDEPYYMYQLPENAKVLDKDGNLVFPAFRDLYVDGVTQILATSQLRERGIQGVDDYKMFVDSARGATQHELVADDRLLYIHPSLLQDVEVDQDGNIIGSCEVWIRTEWQIQMVHIEHIDKNPGADDYRKHITAPETHSPNGVKETLWACRVPKKEWDVFVGAYYATLRNRVYWMMNNKAYLNEPGEWYYDQDNGIIYLYPDGDIEDMTVSYPLSERLFYMQDMKNISYDNVNMYGCTINFITTEGYFSGQGGRLKNLDENGKVINCFFPYGAVYGDTVTNISFENCNISEVGCDAINFRGVVDGVLVDHCTFKNIGGSAVRSGMGVQGERNTDTKANRNIKITQNYIDNTGVAYNSYTGIMVTSVENLDLSYNTILNSSYSAINVGWSWDNQAEAVLPADFVNVTNANISHNYIENYMTNMQDGGAIYVLGGNATAKETEYLNSMNNNYVVTTAATGNGKTGWTVWYHDSGSSHWHDYDNVLVMDPKLMKLRCAYISYQTNAPAYSCKTERLYLIGYQDDRTYGNLDQQYKNGSRIELESGEDPKALQLSYGALWALGNGVAPELLAKYKVRIKADGSYEVLSEGNIQNQLIITDCYGYVTFEDAKSSDQYDAIQEICKNAGCDAKKPKLADAERLFDDYEDHCPAGEGAAGCWSTDIDKSNPKLYKCNECGQEFIPFRMVH